MAEWKDDDLDDWAKERGEVFDDQEFGAEEFEVAPSRASEPSGEVVLKERSYGKAIECPKCGNGMFIVANRNTLQGFYGCKDYACNGTKSTRGMETCPECSSEMQLRAFRKYKNRFFWGCVRYPRCRGLKDHSFKR